MLKMNHRLVNKQSPGEQQLVPKGKVWQVVKELHLLSFFYNNLPEQGYVSTSVILEKMYIIF